MRRNGIRCDLARLKRKTRSYSNPEQPNAIGRYAHQAPFSPYFLATQDYSWRMPSDFIPDEDYHKLELYQLSQKPLGVNYNMIGMLAVMDSTAHALSLHRTHERFTEQEREILNTIQPHLVNMSAAFENEFAGMARNPVTLIELQRVRHKLKSELPAALTPEQRQFCSVWFPENPTGR